jgi:hypothetical protein
VFGDEPNQPHRVANVVESHLCHAQKEAEKSTQALKKAEGVLIEQRNAVEQEKIAL